MKQSNCPISESSWSSHTPLSFISAAVTRLFRYQVDEYLARSITKGSLTLTFDDETAAIFGETPSEAKSAHHPIATIHVINAPAYYTRISTQGDIGFAEAFMAGDFTVPSAHHLVTIFRLLIINRDEKSLSTPTLLISRLGAYANSALHMLNRNTMSGSRRNITAHYDLSNALFATFLGDTWVYSCGLFTDAGSPSDRNLDDAQLAKIDAILDKARVRPDTDLLDIGCGWGQLAIRAALKYGCHVTGITLSDEQLALGRQRAEQAGVADKVDLRLVDYRQLAAEGRRYHRITSVEMIEAVGHEFLGQFFRAVDDLLAKDGVVCLQVITTPENRYDAYRNSTDFIQKHIFPGGICPSLNAMSSAMARSSDLIIEDVVNIGVHYATTLAEWRRRFVDSVDKGEVCRAGFDEVFIRKWIYYLCYCESGFATRTLGVLQMVLTRVGNVPAFGTPPPCAF